MSTLHPLSESAINWSALIEQYEQSKLNRKQFCRENNISLSQFKYQRTKLKRQSINATTTPLIPISIKATSTINPTRADKHFQITFNNGIYCQIPIQVEAEKLKQLMEVLQAC